MSEQENFPGIFLPIQFSCSSFPPTRPRSIKINILKNCYYLSCAVVLIIYIFVSVLNKLMKLRYRLLRNRRHLNSIIEGSRKKHQLLADMFGNLEPPKRLHTFKST